MIRACAALAALGLAGALGCGAAHEPPVEAAIASPPADSNASAAPPPTAALAPSPPLPVATAEVAASSADAPPGVDVTAPTLTVTIDKAGAVRVGDKRLKDDSLLAAARAAVMTNPNTRVIVAADKDTRHGDVIHVLDLLKQAGITKIAFAVSPSGK